jgi:DNA helicase-2/ATP-dependent DNA helicase PcrA
MISFAASRRMYNNWQDSIPSRFIDELPAGSVKVNTTITDRPGRNNYANADSSFTRGGYAAMRTRTAEPWEARPRPPAKHGYRIGARVFHQKFGYGVVRAVDNNTLEVAFEQTGLKHIMSDFLEPAA